MHQVKENVENSVQTKKICTLVQVCREIWKGSKVCRRRKKFENHCARTLVGGFRVYPKCVCHTEKLSHLGYLYSAINVLPTFTVKLH